jgi:hypothetical protein
LTSCERRNDTGSDLGAMSGGRPIGKITLNVVDLFVTTFNVYGPKKQSVARHHSWNAEMNAIVPISSGAALSAALAPDLTRAADLAGAEKAETTRRAYRSDFRIFEAWCRGRR